jgi:hypothetical protein
MKFYKLQWVRFKLNKSFYEGYVIKVCSNGNLHVAPDPNNEKLFFLIHKDDVIEAEMIV